MKQWFVVQTHPNGEIKAALNLRRQNFSIYLPQYLKLRRHARRRDWVRAPLFPRYLFVSLDLGADRWSAVRSTMGVSHLICNGNDPVPVPDAIIGAIRAREDAQGIVSLNRVVPLRRGESVRVLAGAFSDQVAIFDCETAADRVRVLLNLLGRIVRIELPLDAVGAAA